MYLSKFLWKKMTQDCNPRNRPEYNDNFRPDLGENQIYFGAEGVGERWIGTGLGITIFFFSLLVECDRCAIFVKISAQYLFLNIN